MLYKAQRTGLQDPNLEQEMDSLQKIARASLSALKSIQVPRLFGYVKYTKNRHIIGLLRGRFRPTYIVSEILTFLLYLEREGRSGQPRSAGQ